MTTDRDDLSRPVRPRRRMLTRGRAAKRLGRLTEAAGLSRSAVSMAAVLALAACTGKHVSPLTPPPYRTEMAAPYGATWSAIVRALARQNTPLRAIARDSGVIASDEFVTPIGVYADCGSLGGARIEGDALVSYTLFVGPNGDGTRIQINSKMRTFGHGKGSYPCVSTLRFEANLADAVRELVKE